MDVSFAVPFVPPTLNEWSRCHWKVRAEHSRNWCKIIHCYAPKGPRPLVDVPMVVRLTFQSRRARDNDSMAKFVLDGCRGIVFPDDSPQWITELRTRWRKGNPEVTIEAWRVECPEPKN